MTRNHVCVFFEDRWPDHVCVCGATAAVLLDEDGQGTLVVLDGRPTGSAAGVQELRVPA